MPKKIVKLIDGKAIAQEILADLKRQISKMPARPGLAAILVGDDPASKLYVKNKEKQSHKIGINFHKYLCNYDCCKNVTEKEILEMIKFLNEDPEVRGILVQLPLPKKFDTEKIIAAIDPKKDVDGFQPDNLKKFLAGEINYPPPLVAAIITILQHERIDLSQKKIIVVTHSKIFGPALKKALTDFQLAAAAGLPSPLTVGVSSPTVQLISETNPDLKQKTNQADILISIVGKPEFITDDFIKPDAIIIDVGITLTDDGFKGDVDFESVKFKAALLTPTPGGVGPVTVAMVLKNVCELAKQ